MRARRPLGVVLAAVLASGAAGAESRFESAGLPPMPILLSAGPYGDPFATGPALIRTQDLAGLDWQVSPIVTGESGSRVRVDPQAIVPGLSVRPPRPAFDPDSDDGLPALPGTFKRTQTLIPGGPAQKAKVVAPHLTPDVELAVSKRASIGLFGAIGRVEIDQRSALAPNAKTRELGAGLSLQYRFGQ